MPQGKYPHKRTCLMRQLLRTVLLIALCVVYIRDRSTLDFAAGLSDRPWLIALWLWLLADIVSRMLPLPWHPIGMTKWRKSRYIPRTPQPDAAVLQAEKRRLNRQLLPTLAVYAIANSWYWLPCAAYALTGRPAFIGSLGAPELLLITALYYFGDTVFILIFCPFRDLALNNRCCTACRIYNYDAIMTVTPLLLMPCTLFSAPLIVLSLLHAIIWEVSLQRHPERFSLRFNAALACGSCGCDHCPTKRPFWPLSKLRKKATS